MNDVRTPLLSLASALQDLFEVAGELARDVPPGRRRYFDDRFRRIQAARAEVVEWAEENRS